MVYHDVRSRQFQLQNSIPKFIMWSRSHHTVPGVENLTWLLILWPCSSRPGQECIMYYGCESCWFPGIVQCSTCPCVTVVTCLWLRVRAISSCRYTVPQRYITQGVNKPLKWSNISHGDSHWPNRLITRYNTYSSQRTENTLGRRGWSQWLGTGLVFL